MQSTGHLFLTGLTGSLGSWIAGVALGQGARITALVRADSRRQARRRAEEALRIVGLDEGFDRLEVLCGDITQDARPAVETVDAVVHCAAAMDFAESARRHLEHVNITGTERLCAWAESWAVPLIHVSTAYVAGCRTDLALETELDRGQDFHNPYEQTKWQAEKVVQQWARCTGLPLTILRPSIVVGDTRHGRIVNYDGLYNLMRFFDAIAPELGSDRFRVQARPAATKNVVPVDWVARAAWQIIRDGHRGTFHLTHPQPVRLQQLRDWFVELFDVPGGQLVDPESYRRQAPTRLEQVFHRAAATYLPYLLDETRFDRTHTERVLGPTAAAVPTIDQDFLARLLAQARASRWGRRPRNNTGATAVPARVRQYFEDFLATRLNRPLLPNLHRLNGSCHIRLADWPDCGWTLTIEAGCLKHIGRDPEAACTFRLNEATFHQIVSGRLSPQQAFGQQQVEIEGSIETGLSLATALAGFFQLHPYRDSEEDAA